MKKFIKNNWLVILIFTITASFVTVKSIGAAKNANNLERKRDEIVAQCKEDMDKSDNEFYISSCQTMIDKYDMKIDFYTVMTEAVSRQEYLSLFSFFIISLPIIYNINRKNKDKNIKKEISKNGYKSYMTRYIGSSLKYIWIMPALGLIMILICACNFTLDPAFFLDSPSNVWASYSILTNHVSMFTILYLLNLLLHAVLYTEITLIACRHKHNFILTFIIASGLYIGTEFLVEFFISPVIFKGKLVSLLNIIGSYTFDTSLGIWPIFVFDLIMILIFAFFVYLTYRNKDKYTSQYEKVNKKRSLI